MGVAYFEKTVVKTTDRKRGIAYDYGTINIRSKQLTPLIGKKVRIMIKPIDEKSETWNDFAKNTKEPPNY